MPQRSRACRCLERVIRLWLIVCVEQALLHLSSVALIKIRQDMMRVTRSALVPGHQKDVSIYTTILIETLPSNIIGPAPDRTSHPSRNAYLLHQFLDRDDIRPDSEYDRPRLRQPTQCLSFHPKPHHAWLHGRFRLLVCNVRGKRWWELIEQPKA